MAIKPAAPVCATPAAPGAPAAALVLPAVAEASLVAVEPATLAAAPAMLEGAAATCAVDSEVPPVSTGWVDLLLSDPQAAAASRNVR